MRSDPGWVYVLTHPAWTKIGIVKIGMTSRDPSKRLAEITSSSGLVAPGRVHHCVWVDNRAAIEQAVKDRLRVHRVRGRRELFRIDPNAAAGVLNELNGVVSVRVERKPRRRRFKAKRSVGVDSLLIGLAIAVVCLLAVFSGIVISDLNLEAPYGYRLLHRL